MLRYHFMYVYQNHLFPLLQFKRESDTKIYMHCTNYNSIILQVLNYLSAPEIF